MGTRSIGRLIAIKRSVIEAELYASVGSYVNTNDGTRFVGEVGTYVSIYDVERIVIGEIVGIGDYAEDVKDGGLKKPSVRRKLEISLVGEIINDKFTFGVSRMPLIYSEVNLVAEDELQIMLSRGKPKIDMGNDLSVGQSVYFSDTPIRVDINKFFGFHFAVFGNTGSGKSNTIATIVQKIIGDTKKVARNAKIVVVDSNGEYKAAFETLTNRELSISTKFLDADADFEDEGSEKFQIPVWALGVDDWAVLLHASEKTQLPIIKRAIDLMPYYLSHDDRGKDVKNHILASVIIALLLSSDTTTSKSDKVISLMTCFYTNEIALDKAIPNIGTLRTCLGISYGKMANAEKLIGYLQAFLRPDILTSHMRIECPPYDLNDFYGAIELAALYEGSVRTQRIQEYTATLITRLEALRDNGKGRLFSKTSFSTLKDYIEDMIGKNQLVNIDISSLDDSEGEMVVKVISKLLLDYVKSISPRATKPINLIVEEAHRYIRDAHDYGAVGYDVFERISKEGRKFGLLLGISSQRPRDLSETVVSQCSNFIIHRIQSPEDLNYISRMVPYIDKTGIDRLTYLQTGHGLVFGTAISIPSLTVFPVANPQPDSKNAQINSAWYRTEAESEPRPKAVDDDVVNELESTTVQNDSDAYTDAN